MLLLCLSTKLKAKLELHFTIIWKTWKNPSLDIYRYCQNKQAGNGPNRRLAWGSKRAFVLKLKHQKNPNFWIFFEKSRWCRKTQKPSLNVFSKATTWNNVKGYPLIKLKTFSKKTVAQRLFGPFPSCENRKNAHPGVQTTALALQLRTHPLHQFGRFQMKFIEFMNIYKSGLFMVTEEKTYHCKSCACFSKGADNCSVCRARRPLWKLHRTQVEKKEKNCPFLVHPVPPIIQKMQTTRIKVGSAKKEQSSISWFRVFGDCPIFTFKVSTFPAIISP